MERQMLVRFVPKNRVAAPRILAFTALAPTAAHDIAPDKRRATEAQRALLRLSVPTELSTTSRLESRMTVEQFESTFKVSVTEDKSAFQRDRKEVPRTEITRQETFLKPKGEIPIPEALRDTVDFAYVPRPVEYASFIPPTESVYHLSLQSVALALNAIRCNREKWTGEGVKVAMADSGFAPHAFFEQGGYRITRLGAPGVTDPTSDDPGHGTGESANVIAVAPSATLICVKQGASAAADIETCLAQQPDIMTHSWGWNIDDMSKDDLKKNDPNMYNEVVDVETLLAQAVARGVIVCFAAGNGHRFFPASLPFVIACGGTTVMPDGSLTASSYASSFRSMLYPGRNVPDVCGVVGEYATATPMKGHIMLPVPMNSNYDGENFEPARKGAGWGIFSGTSAASPQIAGVIALMKGINRSLTPDSVRSILASSAIDVVTGKSALGDEAGVGIDPATGAGFVDAYRACKSAAAIA